MHLVEKWCTPGRSVGESRAGFGRQRGGGGLTSYAMNARTQLLVAYQISPPPVRKALAFYLQSLRILEETNRLAKNGAPPL